MYELIVLGLLMQSPLHAYLITKITNETIGPWESISKGTLSTLLAKLKNNGIIALADPSIVPYKIERRSSQVYALTSAGEERFYHLMMDNTSNMGNYQKIFRIKSLHLSFLEIDDQLYLVNHYQHYCQTAIQHILVELKDFEKSSDKKTHSSQQFYETVIDQLNLQLEQWKLEVEWTQRLQKRIELQHNKAT
ncbi:PadR family transcriptional regulator [Paenibacillus sp. KQZ6P-2]|uniref:PadR family transcriptional regulator n=1 Tax=Paenibacillus mangrovi TaxID=2931978 RepID=A0A9X1WT30_9BACL|nr:PadR family transcriptional regulator [Paenibacillus mangrovi]MCJ8014827.1 PadR family transcriptional regulator [Paenibacillus mangrovi]